MFDKKEDKTKVLIEIKDSLMSEINDIIKSQKITKRMFFETAATEFIKQFKEYNKKQK